MKFYSCKVRLGGGTNNEVRKGGKHVIGKTDDERGIEVVGIPTPEVMILRHIHGLDAVVDIEATDDKKVPTSALRDYLRATYTKLIDHGGREIPLVDFLFPEGQPFPIFVSSATDIDDEEDIAPPPSSRGKKGTAADAAA